MGNGRATKQLFLRRATNGLSLYYRVTNGLLELKILMAIGEMVLKVLTLLPSLVPNGVVLHLVYRRHIFGDFRPLCRWFIRSETPVQQNCCGVDVATIMLFVEMGDHLSFARAPATSSVPCTDCETHVCSYE